MIFDDFFTGTSEEGRYVPFSAGGVSSSGETVNECSAMSLPAYFACLKVISEDVAKIPVRVYSKKGANKTLAPAGDPLRAQIEGRFCPVCDNQSFRQTLTWHAASWGSGFAEIAEDGRGGTSLWIIHPSRVRPFLHEGRLYYRVTVDDINRRGKTGSHLTFPSEDMLHISGVGGDGISGYSVLRYASDSIGLGLGAQRYGASFFKNTGKPVGVLEHPQQLGAEAATALRGSWSEIYGGSSNAGKVAILEEGMTFKPISIPPEEAQFLETRQFQIEDICRWFRIAPVKIQHNQNVPFANMEQLNISHIQDALMPWLLRWEVELRDKLVPSSRRMSTEVEHDTFQFLRGDSLQQANVDVKYHTSGLMKGNEIRERLGLNPLDSGDIPLVQQGMTTLPSIIEGRNLRQSPSSTIQGEPGRPSRKASLAMLRPVLHDAARRMLAREANARLRASKKGDVQEWAREFFSSDSQTCMAWREAVEPYQQAIGRSVVLGEMVSEHLTACAAGHASWPDAEAFVQEYYRREGEGE